MLSTLKTLDIIVVVVLLIFLVVASLYSSFKKKSAEEYFMAGRSLRWWSVAGSIFGTNIHAQQIIGMMSVGFSIGFAQSHYEVWAVPAVLVLAYIFVPIYRKRSFFTLSEFLEQRYNSYARLAYVIVIFAFILGQLVAGFYIGSRILGLLFAGTSIEMTYLTGILTIASVTVFFSVFGGMESVVIADNILTVIMILSILLMGYFTYSQPEINGISGLLSLDHASANKMHLYLPANHPKLPWPGIFTGLTILNFFYWTTNQYQVQRVMAAKTEKDAKLGALAAGFLKLIIPFFSIAVGTAGFYLFSARLGEGAVKPDDIFLMLLKTVVPNGYGITGLILTGLICAIFSAIYSMMNSVSTMFAFDVYRKYINKNSTDGQTVMSGRAFVLLMCAIASFFAFTTYDPNSTENFFLKLADQVSYLKPGLVIAFFWGVFWKKTNPWAAVIILLSSPFIGLGCDFVYNHFLNQNQWILNTFGEKLNFLYRVFLITVVGSMLIFGLSLFLNKKNTVYETELTVPLNGLGSKVFVFGLVQLFWLLTIYFHIFTTQNVALFASITAFLFFTKSLRGKFWENDVFYAGLLVSITTWILYFFA